MQRKLQNIVSQFPALQHANSCVYLDSAATTQKPGCVIDAMNTHMKSCTANVHRGVHGIAETTTGQFEHARGVCRDFLGAHSSDEIVFTRNTTESINLVAHSWARQHLQKGDMVFLSIFEHHSNIVPWLQLKEERGIGIEWIPTTEDGELDLDAYKELLSSHAVKLVSITGQSNVTGYKPPLRQIVDAAHEQKAKVLLDAAQLAAHEAIDVQKLNCDFLALSGHKLYGPSGIGALYLKQEHAETMPPFLGGGGMIDQVHRDSFTPAPPPHRFEAGTPPIAQAIGLAAALTWIEDIGWEAIESYEAEVAEYAVEQLQAIPNITLHVARATLHDAPIIPFTIDGMHAHDLTHIMSDKGVHLRAGHHCAQPLHDHLGIPATTRLSLGIYNTKDDIDACIKAIHNATAVLNP